MVIRAEALMDALDYQLMERGMDEGAEPYRNATKDFGVFGARSYGTNPLTLQEI